MEKTSTIAYLTAGAAGMYCGSCLRDNALAAALQRLGCDIQLIPTYTPIRTDEEDVSNREIFFGGINVFLQQKSRLFRRLPRFLDRPLDSPWLIEKLASGGIETDARQLGELTVSMLKGEQGYQKKEIGRLVDWLDSHVQPALVNLTNVLIAGCVPALKRTLAAPVLVTLQGDDLFLDNLAEPYRSQALKSIAAIAEQVDGFVVFSEYYADYMSQFLQIPRSKMHLAPLGLNLRDFHDGENQPQDRPTIGYLARIAPEKGFHQLVDAFLELRKRPAMSDVQLRAAGWLGPQDRAFYQEQLEKLRQAGAERDFHYAGVVERTEKLEFLRQIDLLSVPTIYQEPKGLYVLEALASTVPVVVPGHGAFPELLRGTGGGVLFRPGDVSHLIEQLHHLLGDPALRRQLGAQGRDRVARHFSDTDMAVRTMQIYRKFLTQDQARGWRDKSLESLAR